MSVNQLVQIIVPLDEVAIGCHDYRLMDDVIEQTFGLPPSLRIPIAAKDVETIQRYVGSIERQVVHYSGRVNAVLVRAVVPDIKHSTVPLWFRDDAAQSLQRLHPERQLWVHVDYTGYRSAWARLGFAKLDRDTFLDHIQNREAVRIAGYQHPYLRLCPVSRRVNSSGGAKTGGEGIEKEHLQNLHKLHPSQLEEVVCAMRAPLQIADPMDLTKMLNISPGTKTLPGVASMLHLFYPLEA